MTRDVTRCDFLGAALTLGMTQRTNQETSYGCSPSGA